MESLYYGRTLTMHHWSVKEVEWMHRLLAEGKTRQQVASTIGRSQKSIHRRLRYERMTPAQWKAWREHINASRKIQDTRSPRLFLDRADISFRPSNDMLRERDRRLAVPSRDLTAEILGDPKPGYSALDRQKRISCRF